MKKPVAYARLFALTVVVFGSIFLWRIWQISPLFLQADVRKSAEAAMRSLEKEKGWLLSDLSVRHVTASEMTVVYRNHIRGRDPETCYRVDLLSFASRPCDTDR